MFFFFNDTATTEIYTLSLHDALPICRMYSRYGMPSTSRMRAPKATPKTTTYNSDVSSGGMIVCIQTLVKRRDRKSTRLNSSHANISYAVFCLKKKKNTNISHIYSPSS